MWIPGPPAHPAIAPPTFTAINGISQSNLPLFHHQTSPMDIHGPHSAAHRGHKNKLSDRSHKHQSPSATQFKPNNTPSVVRTAAYILLALPMTFMLTYIMLSPSFTFTSLSLSFLTSVQGTCRPLPTNLNITTHLPLPLAPSPLPSPHHSTDAQEIIPLILNLTRTTLFKSIANISLQGTTHEPEGLLRLGADRYILSTGEWTSPRLTHPNGTTSPGSGFAHLMVYTGNGTLIADASVSALDAPEYHNGGIDYDGTSIWGVLSPYFPSTSGTVYAADPSTLLPKTILHHSDHLGTLSINPLSKTITALNWGSRIAATFKIPSSCRTQPFVTSVKNPSHFIDYQDCKFLGPWESHTLMLCSGVNNLNHEYNLGGIALVDINSMLAIAEIPITLESSRGVRMTQNPMDVSVEDGRLRFYWVPDQQDSTLYIYEAQL